jgi:hypothetical protein
MLAQIEGLNTCSLTATDSLLEEGTGFGEATLELQENCETAFNIELKDVDVLALSHDLYVNNTLVATFDFDTIDDGSGTVTGFVRFDPIPDVGELLLDFAVGSGSLVEVFTAGANPTVDLPVLSGTLL